MWKMVLETYTSLTSRISKDSVTVVRVELANGERIVGMPLHAPHVWSLLYTQLPRQRASGDLQR
jgi:hypothetical protein